MQEIDEAYFCSYFHLCVYHFSQGRPGLNQYPVPKSKTEPRKIAR